MRTIEEVIAELKDEMLDGGFTEIHCDKCLDEILEIHEAEQEKAQSYLQKANATNAKLIQIVESKEKRPKGHWYKKNYLTVIGSALVQNVTMVEGLNG